MSDGMSDGYRMELEARRQDERMSEFGKSECFYCGTKMTDGPQVKERSDPERHRHLSGIHISGGRPVSFMPEEIGFCSYQCKDWWGDVCRALSAVTTTIANSTSPAVKMSLLRALDKTLRDTRRPDV